MANHSLHGGMFALVLTTFAIACGGTHPRVQSPADGTPKEPAAARAEVHERVVPHTCAARTKLAQALGHTTPPPPVAPDQAADSAPPPTSVGAGTKLAANQAYRSVAPATVLVRSEHGMGTGVVIDPKGYVLTNYHVVAEGEKHDFVISVTVTFGDLTATGRMTRQEKAYDAVVVKADPVRDMALIKIKDPPPKIETVKLAKSAPQIGEKVMSVGHAGIGFLWAAKSCSIASIGERQQDTGMLAALDCSHVDPAMSPDEATRQKTRCDEQKKRMTDALGASTQGLALQTDCAITHGDSGGPLVNVAGELVGLNQSITVDAATAAFHVHLDEIRDFSAKYGDEGIAILPDPFCDGGNEATLEDIDLDGTAETLVTKGSSGPFGGYDRMSLLIDLDQNHFTKKKDANDTFDAEIALLTLREAAYIWYDTDNDARFDLLLVDKDNDGKPELAYRLDAEGHARLDKDALPKHDFSSKLVSDASLHARLGKIANAIGGTKYLSNKMVAAASKAQSLPDPLLGGGTSGRVLDTDANGKSDVAFVRSTFSRALLIDADENSLGAIKSGEPADELVKAKKIDAEISIVVEGNAVWAFYDTNDDAKFDLVLMTTNGTDATSLTVTSAWRLSGPGETTPAPDQIGRKILRPGLVPFPRATTSMRILSSDMATDEGMGSLPDPFATSTKTRFRAREIKGVPAASVIEATTPTSSIMLVDVDHDTKMPPKDPDLQKLVTDRKFDAEVAIVHHAGPDGGSDWIYYDTDADGKFDLVLFAAASGHEPVQAYRLTNAAKPAIEADAAAVPGKTFRTKSAFKDKAMAAKWKALAGKLFKAASIED